MGMYAHLFVLIFVLILLYFMLNQYEFFNTNIYSSRIPENGGLYVLLYDPNAGNEKWYLNNKSDFGGLKKFIDPPSHAFVYSRRSHPDVSVSSTSTEKIGEI